MVADPRGGKTPLFTSKGEINPKIPKEILKVLGPKRQEKLKELNKSIQEDKRIAEDENEDSAERERAGERITEKRQQIDNLENEDGNGLKDLGKKVAQILPGLIGTIVSFIFRTAGSVIGFLGKNAWLLILGVVIFAVEQFQKSDVRHA